MSELDNSYLWQGREDIEDGEQGLRWHQVIRPDSSKAATALVGFACDVGVKANKGRVGAKEGPNKIRGALANLAWHGHTGISDKGTIIASDDLDGSQLAYADQISKALNTHTMVIGLGGGHEIAWGSYQGLYQHLASANNNKIGIINFDAHFDLRQPSPDTSSGTPFRQVAQHCQQHNHTFHYACLGVAEAANTPALFNYAKELKVRYLRDSECCTDAAKALLMPFLQEIDELYLTICLDAFPAYIAPGVSAPSSLGIAPQFVLDLIHWLANSQDELAYRWRLSDIAELNPSFDIDDRTAKLAARLLFEIVQATGS